MFHRRKKYLKKPKKIIKCAILFSLIGILLIGLILDKHLYTLQREERISKVVDYRTFQLSYQEQNRCQTEKKFQAQDTIFYYQCLEEIYMKYGSTITTLQDIMQSGYLTLKEFLATTKEVVYEGDNKTVYYHLQTKDSAGYKVIVENEEKYTKVTISKYLNE